MGLCARALWKWNEWCWMWAWGHLGARKKFFAFNPEVSTKKVFSAHCCTRIYTREKWSTVPTFRQPSPNTTLTKSRAFFPHPLLLDFNLSWLCLDPLSQPCHLFTQWMEKHHGRGDCSLNDITVLVAHDISFSSVKVHTWVRTWSGWKVCRSQGIAPFAGFVQHSRVASQYFSCLAACLDWTSSKSWKFVGSVATNI